MRIFLYFISFCSILNPLKSPEGEVVLTDVKNVMIFVDTSDDYLELLIQEKLLLINLYWAYTNNTVNNTLKYNALKCNIALCVIETKTSAADKKEEMNVRDKANYFVLMNTFLRQVPASAFKSSSFLCESTLNYCRFLQCTIYRITFDSILFPNVEIWR